MNAVVAAGGATCAAFVYRAIAAEAARERTLVLGALPVPLPVTVAIVAAVAARAGAHPAAILACGGVAIAAWADARTGSIFDPVSIALFAVSLVLAGIAGTTLDGLAGATCIGATLFALHALTRGRGLGLGDVKLATALGMALGLASGFTAIGWAFVFGGVYGGWLLAVRRARRDTAIRFGPFIAAGTGAALIIPLGVAS